MIDKSENIKNENICHELPKSSSTQNLKAEIHPQRKVEGNNDDNFADTIDVEIHLIGSSEPSSSIHKRMAKIDVSEFFYSSTPRAGKPVVTPTVINTTIMNADPSYSPEILDELLLELGLQEFGQYFSSASSD
jgi:hypothetical protein